MGYIGKKPATQGKDAGPSLKLDDISSNFDGNTTVFDLTVGGTTVDPHINNIQIYLSGVHQLPGTSYSLSGSQVVFTGAPSSSLNFHGSLIGDSRIMTPDNNTVEPASFTSNTTDVVSGSWQGVIGSGSLGMVSGSAISTGSFGAVNIGGMSVSNLVDFSSSIASRVTDEESDFTAAGISGSWQGVIGSGSLGMVSGSAISTGSFGRVIVAEMGNSDLTDVSASISTRVNLLEGSGSITESSSSFSTRVSDLVTDSGSFSTRVKLLEGSGSIFESSASFSTRVNLLEGSGSINDLVTDSGSFSTRVNLLEGSGSITESSASFSTRVSDLKTDSGSFSTRVSDLVTDSGSFSTRVTTAEASGALFDGDGEVTFAGATITGTLTAQEVHTEFISASVTVSTGSNIFGDETGDVHQFTGSIETSGSIILDTLGGNVSGSIVSTGSFGAANIAGMTVSNLVDVSSSISTRVSDLVTDSGSFSTRVSDLVTDSGSFSTRVSDLKTDSGSFSTRVSDLNLSLSGSTTLISGSVISTGSFGSVVAGGTGVNTFTGNVTLDNPGSLTRMTLENDTESNLLFTLGGSNKGQLYIDSNGVSLRSESGEDLRFLTGGNNIRMFISASGNIGIGTDSPTGILTIASSTTPSLTFNDTGGGADSKIFRLSGGGDKFFFEGRNDADSDDGDAGTMMTFDLTNGKIGIGDTAPSAPLEVSAGSGKGQGSVGYIGTLIAASSASAQEYDGASSNTWGPKINISNETASSTRTGASLVFAHRAGSSGVAAIVSTNAATDRGDLRFITRGAGNAIAERMIINDDGKVGIGTASPSEMLHVASDARIGGTIRVGDGSAGAPSYRFTSDTDTGMFKEGTNSIGFAVAGVKVATMNDNTLTVFGAASDNAQIRMYADTGTGDNDKYQIVAEDGGGGLKFQTAESSNFVSMAELHANGDVKLNTDVYGNNIGGDTFRNLNIRNDGFLGVDTSSKRYKKNIKDISDISWIYDLRPVDFEWKATNKKDWGLIAEEVLEVNPRIVGIENEVPEWVDYKKLIPILLKAVQELSEKNEAFEKRIKELEN